MAILKRIFQFVLGVILVYAGFPTPNSILKSFCYQFVCDYPLTELPQNACSYCHSISILLFILGILSIVIFVFGLAKDILKSAEKNKNNQRKV